MKLSLPLLATAGMLLIAASGCTDKYDKSGQDDTPPPASSAPKSAAAPAPAPAAPPSGIDYTKVPSTLVVDGKTVTLKSLPSGVKYVDTKVGTGPEIKAGQTASMHYTGTLINGTKFDSTDDHGGSPFEFAVGGGQVIKGWDEGIPGMKVGGKRHLVIPGSMAYGENSPSPNIPPNATLVFDVELVGIK